MKSFFLDASNSPNKVRRIFTEKGGDPIVLYNGRPGEQVAPYLWLFISSYKRLKSKGVR